MIGNFTLRKKRHMHANKIDALRNLLKSGGASHPNAESLARSYGLPVADVEKTIHEMAGKTAGGMA